jgi:beta-N-acetylhexosaminidase
MSRRPSPILVGLILLSLVVTGMSMAPASGLSRVGAADAATLLGPALAARLEEKAGFSGAPSVPGVLSPKAAKALAAYSLPASGKESPDFWSGGDPDALAASLVASMRPEEVLGQVFLLGFPGTVPPPLILDWIEKRGIGGVKIFGWNAEDTTKLAMAIDEIQSASLRAGTGSPSSSPPTRKAASSAT